MISTLNLTNFKSWNKVQQMEFGRITGLFGSNSSGKTSILQFFQMIKQTVNSSDRGQVLSLGGEADYVRLGSFKDMIFQHNISNRLGWSLDWKLSNEMKILDPATKNRLLFKSDQVTQSAEISGSDTGEMRVERMAYKFSGYEFFMSRMKPDEERYKLGNSPSDFRFIRARGRAWDLPSPIKCYGFPDQVKAYFKNADFLGELELAFKELADNLFFLGPLREYPQRQYTWVGSQPVDMGSKGEAVVHALLASRHRELMISRGKGYERLSVEEYVAHWLKELGLIYDFSVVEIAKDSNLYQVKVKKSENAVEVLLTDVGFGVSQVLPVLALCYYVPEGATVIFEQPEIHLHPSVQAGLADVFIDAMNVRHIQIVLESHSEHLLRRLQRRLAEEKIRAGDLKLYFCDVSKTASRLIPLDIDGFGHIRNWPKDFFGDEFGEISAIVEAEQSRQGGTRK